MSEQLKAGAFAASTVIVVYCLAFALGRLGNGWQIFLPLDILVYLGIGFFSARALGGWRGAFVVVLFAAFVDEALALGSYVLPGAPHLRPAQIAEVGVVEIGFNLLLGLVGATIGARIGAKR